MSISELPKSIEPIKMCQKAGKGGEVKLVGQMDISKALAIGESLEGSNKPNNTVLVQAELIFGQDQMGLNIITGSLQSQVILRCQRCLGLFDYPMDIALNLSPILSEKELEDLPDYVEPLMIQSDGGILIMSWMAEEIYLALPMVPKHKNRKICDLNLSMEHISG